jgi:hypothetical protein
MNPFVKKVLIIGTPILIAYYLALIFLPGFEGAMMALMAIPFAIPFVMLIIKRKEKQRAQPGVKVKIRHGNSCNLENQISDLEWEVSDLKNKLRNM